MRRSTEPKECRTVGVSSLLRKKHHPVSRFSLTGSLVLVLTDPKVLGRSLQCTVVRMVRQKEFRQCSDGSNCPSPVSRLTKYPPHNLLNVGTVFLWCYWVIIINFIFITFHKMCIVYGQMIRLVTPSVARCYQFIDRNFGLSWPKFWTESATWHTGTRLVKWRGAESTEQPFYPYYYRWSVSNKQKFLMCLSYTFIEQSVIRKSFAIREKGI